MPTRLSRIEGLPLETLRRAIRTAAVRLEHIVGRPALPVPVVAPRRPALRVLRGGLRR